MEKWEGMLRLVVHYVLITLGVLVCGWLYGWYELSVVGVLAMCLTSAAVYFFTSALNYQIYKKTCLLYTSSRRGIRGGSTGTAL